MVNVRFEWLEVVIVILGIVLAFPIIFNPLKEPIYVPNAVTGLSTISGVLTAFIGFWLTHVYSYANKAAKKWISTRAKVVVVFVFVGLLFVMGGLSQLVYGSLDGAYKEAQFGTMIIILILFEVMLMVLFREEISKMKGKSPLI